MSGLELRCPACGAEGLRLDGVAQVCESCARSFENTAGFTDLRLERTAFAPLPLDAQELASLLAALDRGEDFRSSLEALLLAISPEKTDRLMLLLGEGRGSWHPLTRVAEGRALWIGNAFSGSWLPLAQSVFQVLVLDRNPERLRFAAHRALSQPSSQAQFLVGGDSAQLPFADQTFDLVVQEEGLPGPAEAQFAHTLPECLRVTRGECFVTAENRFAYKRSTGRRARFRIPSPLGWLAEAVFPAPGLASLRGHERQLAQADFEPARSHALYPHMRDFTHVVALDGKTPELPIGPLERKNRLKVLGNALGLFPVLAPSFVSGVARLDAGLATTSRLERVLGELSQQIGEPLPEIENWTATRGNCAVVLTRPRGSEESGNWAVHIPMNEKERRELAAHDEHLRFLRENFPAFPVPEPLFSGVLDGLWLSCERRLGGIAATQVSQEPECGKQLLRDTARHLAGLVMRESTPLVSEELERLVGGRFDQVAAKAALPETIEHVRATRETAMAALEGMTIPRVFYHSDIRSKHVRVKRDGTVLGYLDLGCASRNDLPYFDLVNLIVHENKRAGEFASTNAWKRLLAREELRPFDVAALESYASALDLPDDYCRTIEEIYPILVTSMCEQNWDYSRPRWLFEHFGY